MPSLPDTWPPLLVAAHPDGGAWAPRELRAMSKALQAWDFRGVQRHRPPLVEWSPDYMGADALVRWADSILGDGDGPVWGMTARDGSRVTVLLARDGFRMGAEAMASVAAHELGHVLGLGHSERGIMAPRLSTAVPVCAPARRRAAALRARGVVGPQAEPVTA